MTIYGWDVSSNDAPAADGISFLVHRADGEIGAFWDAVRERDPERVLAGAYWVLRPEGPAGQADRFLARLDQDCPGWRDRPFLLRADCEKWEGEPTTVPSKAAIGTFCDRLTERRPEIRPLVYAPRWVHGDALTGLAYPLWASSYVAGAGTFEVLYPGDRSSRWAAYSGQTPAVLRYSTSATIGGRPAGDVSAFRGTLAELTSLAAPGHVLRGGEAGQGRRRSAGSVNAGGA